MQELFRYEPTSFIGRQDELRALHALLADPACRLLTLLGPGGIGKSRLAHEAATRSAPRFADGVVAVDLDAVTSADGLLATLPAALQLPLGGDPLALLRRALRDRAMLLLLDPFEQLVATSGLLVDLLAAAPDLKLLVASREALCLQEEWRYPLGGLTLPAEAAEVAPEAADATRLFVARARQIQPALDPAAEWEGIVRICRLVEGMPLALELAAAEAASLPCAAIAAEIGRSLDVLASGLRNVPPRHRSVRAVFDQAWARLDGQQRPAFARLAVFAGSFTYPAATEVAGASIPLLTTLRNRALLQRDGRGRYRLHALLRQYAAAQLAVDPAGERAARRRHGAYYTAFVAARDAAMNGAGQHAALAEISAELDNVRAAWRYAAGQADAAALQRAADGLYLCLQFQSRFREGAELFAYAVERLTPHADGQRARITLAEILCHLGWLQVRLGQIDRACRTLEASQAHYAALDAPPPARGMATDPAVALGVIATVRGDYAAAVGYGQDVLRRAEARGDDGNAMFGAYVLTGAALARGDDREAEQYAWRAYHTAAEVLGNRWFMAYCRINLGDIALARGDAGAAREHYQAAYAVRESFADPEGQALALQRLGRVALHEGQPGAARQVYGQALAIYRTLDDQGGLAAALTGLGRAALASGDDADARQHLRAALQTAAASRLTHLLLSGLLPSARLLLRAGEADLAAATLAALRAHPAASRELRAAASELRDSSEVSGARDAAGADVAALANAVAQRLAQGCEPLAVQATEAAPAISSREREVLALVAAGCSNREIAARLVISVGTVKAHIHKICAKLGARNRSHAAALAQERDLLADHENKPPDQSPGQ